MDLSLYKLRDKKFRFIVHDQDENPVDLLAADIYFVLKTSEGEGLKILEKNTEEGDIEISGEHNHICSIRITREDTRNITPKAYKYEILFVLPENGETRWYTGTISSFEVKDVLYNK